MSDTKHILSGFGWQTVLKVAGNVVALIKLAILARLLSPEQFGVFSLVTIALGVVESATQTGVNVTLLQSKKSVSYFLDTAWVIAIIRGFIISCLMVLLGFIMSEYYQKPDLLFLVALASLVPAIKGFIHPMIVSYQKNLAFFKDTSYRFSLLAVDALLACLLVYGLGGVVGWVGALIGAAIFEVILSHRLFAQKPRFVFLPSRGQEILQPAKSLAFSSLFGYLLENIDNVIIGKVVGTYGLGLYQQSYGLTHETSYELTKSIHHGAFPVLSKIHQDLPRFRQSFFKAMRSGLLLMILASLPLLIAPNIIVSLVFGAAWIPAIPLMRWLVVAGILHGVAMMGYTVFLSVKKVWIMNVHLAISFIGMALLIWWWGSSYGLLGAVVALVISRAITLPVLLWGMYQCLWPGKTVHG